MISLNLVGFELAKVDKGKKIKKVQANSVRDLKKVVGKSRLYVLPRAEVSQASNVPQSQSPNITATDPASSLREMLPVTASDLETSNVPQSQPPNITATDPPSSLQEMLPVTTSDLEDIFQQQNVVVWRTSDQSEGSDDLDVPSLEDMYSDHIQVVGDLQLLNPGSATYSNYIDIMPDNEIEIMPDNEIVELDEALDASEVV
ncbi:hypothetical protein E1301_Tti023421 [Triplophysa tibetana]|uniref:Uncharacterized protein n=1 Tax=Triplophysa tibetana TaxID=1572043 RepID=A0A5A9PPT4_9TELE|nr:hypothetical protein E1301_Tti021100 [Triplophysa tibetana]KAA0724170.1 hypothetical protein E1301_Tti023421 [Triplophysa tibetana]